MTNLTKLGLSLLLGSFLAVPLGAEHRAEPGAYLLRAPADAVEEIAARHQLEVVGLVRQAGDPLGRSIFEVRSADPGASESLAGEIEASEPAAVGMEPVRLASLPESGADLDLALDQSTMAILGTLGDPAETPFGIASNEDGRTVWQGYVDQPAARLMRVGEAQGDTRGTGAVVAILDTGVDPSHPLLADSLVPGYDFVHGEPGAASEWSDLLDQSTMAILGQSTMAILGDEEVVQLNQSTMAILGGDQSTELDPASLPPAFGHGTMVAGIVHRTAPGAKIMPLKVFDGQGRGDLADIVRAIYYAVDHGAHVINMSFSLETFSPELMRAVNYAARKGVACVASAGNEGRETIVYPAALGNTIGVASSRFDDYLSPFSNYGSDLVTVAAPGQGVITTYPGGGWAAVSGTSFAAPWVSGAVALFAEKNHGEDRPLEADYFLAVDALSHALPVHGHGNGRSGYGRVDLRTAIKQLQKP